jgi:hypothetical protein
VVIIDGHVDHCPLGQAAAMFGSELRKSWSVLAPGKEQSTTVTSRPPVSTAP